VSVIKRMLEEKRLNHPIQWDRDRILALLEVSDKAVMRAVMRIHKNQVINRNTKQPGVGLGWNAYDRTNMERMAGYLNNGWKLTEGQLKYLRGHDSGKPNLHSRIGKYWRQLLREYEKKDRPQRRLI